MLRNDPSVFAVGNQYQIIVTTKSQAFVSVKVGGDLFVDDSNGILRSSSKTHIVSVPQSLLNTEKKYTVIEKGIIKRLSYFTKTRKDKKYEFTFRPVPSDNIRFYHVADAHNEIDLPIDAAKAFGDIDFLILNGDIPEDSGRISNFNTVYDIAGGITHGNIPCVFSRGNHDLRGICAEKYSEYTPTMNGKSYYSFRLGSIWGLCLDCGEDKRDDHPEYGLSVACHQFREKETEYIRNLIKNKETEYEAADVKYRLIIVHHPFTHRFESPFDIEEDLFREWADLLKNFIKPDIMICGHTHRFGIFNPGSNFDNYGQPCTVVVGSEVIKKHIDFGGAGFVLNNHSAEVTFNRNDGKILKKETIF